MKTVLFALLALMSTSVFAQDVYNVVCHLTNGSRKPLAVCELSNWSALTEVVNPKGNATYKLDMSQCRIDAKFKSSDYLIFLNYINEEDNKDRIEVSAHVTTGQGTDSVTTTSSQHVFPSENGMFYLLHNVFKLDQVDGKDVVLACGDSIPLEFPKTKKLRF